MNTSMNPKQAVLLFLLLITILVVVSLLPDGLGVCMDAWCINGNEPFNP